MRVRKFILTIFLFAIIFCWRKNAFCQPETIIVNKISSLTGRFILKKPSKNNISLYLDTVDIKELVTPKEFIEMKSKYSFLTNGSFKMDKTTIDTTYWTISDFSDKILIENYDEDLNYNYVLQKYHLDPDENFRDTIWRYNADNCFRRKLVNRISKPVFNFQMTVCAIEVFDEDICGEGFRERTFLFFKENNEWILFDFILGRQARY